MVEFDFKGIKVVATVVIDRQEYKDSNYKAQTRFNRDVVASVGFWNFNIVNDLYDFAFVKSTLNYFMQCYWKRTSKEGSKIDLATALEHGDDRPPYVINQSLNMVARQKDKKHFLEISLTENGKPAGKVYLSGREVIMLDIAISKAIHLLSPRTIFLAN
jgi:hypothetical protein